MKIVRMYATLAWVMFLLLVPLTIHYAWIRVRDGFYALPLADQRRNVGRFQNGWGERFLTLVSWGLGLTYSFDIPPEARDRPFIVISNHRSVFDIVLMHVLERRRGRDDAKWISKEENRYLVAAGASAAFMGSAFLRRKDATRKDVGEIRRCAKLARDEGTSVIIYPEGTRYIGPREGWRNVRTPKIAGFKALCHILPDYPVLVATVRWEGLDGHVKGFRDAARGMIGARVHISARVEANPGFKNAEAWLENTWRRMDAELEPAPEPVPASVRAALTSAG